MRHVKWAKLRVGDRKYRMYEMKHEQFYFIAALASSRPKMNERQMSVLVDGRRRV